MIQMVCTAFFVPISDPFIKFFIHLDEDFNVPSTEVVLNMMLDMCVTISVETDNLFEGDEPFSLTIISASVPAIYSDPAMSIVIDAESMFII